MDRNKDIRFRIFDVSRGVCRALTDSRPDSPEHQARSSIITPLIREAAGLLTDEIREELL